MGCGEGGYRLLRTGQDDLESGVLGEGAGNAREDDLGALVTAERIDADPRPHHLSTPSPETIALKRSKPVSMASALARTASIRPAQ